MKRILVVEDEASIRELVALNLKMTGWEVLEAPSAERALELIQKNPPCDVALLDIMLPGMDGFSLCETIRHGDPYIGIIMASAKGQESDKIRGLSIGADDYIIPREEVVFAMDAVVDPVSLFDPVYSDGGDTVCVLDQVRDTRNTDESWLDRIALREAVDKLSPREQRILAMRFYDGKTQMEVSGEIGISQAQVSRLEKNAISTIRRNL